MDLKETSVKTKNWIDLAQYRDYWRVLVNVAQEKLVKQYEAVKYLLT